MRLIKGILKKVGEGGERLLREDGFFFVALMILNAPIISYAGNLQSGVINFWFGAFTLFLVTVALRIVPLKIRRLLQATLTIFFALHFVADVFLLYKFGVPLNLDMLQILLGTNPLTAKAFLRDYVANFKTFAAVVTFIALLAALSFGLRKFFETRSEKRLKRLTFDLLIIFSLPVAVYTFAAFDVSLNVAHAILINTTLGRTGNDVEHLLNTAPIGDEEKIFAEMDKQLASEKILADASDIPFVVFILGEATDRNHMQLYGYRLPTTPHLIARQERGELFSFTDTIACANHTSLAMSRIFTFAEKDAANKDDWFFQANLFDIVRRAGYHTVWLSNQSPLGLWGNFDKYFSARCDEKFFIEAEDRLAKQRQIDGVLLPVLDEFLTRPHEKIFYLIHLYGTHEPFSERYTADFEKFSADDENKPEELWRQVTAEYDNAVLYNDFIIEEIFRRFEDKNAVVIYISDHGTAVFNGYDFVGHAMEESGNVHMIEIPALVWVSKEFCERYPQKISALNAALDRPYRTDYLIHALLDLMDIRTTSFDPTKSIINEQFDSTRPRLYNGKPYSK